MNKHLKPHFIRELPTSPPLKKLLGPSFILLGLGLGSGEVILWPYLSSHFGMGLVWAAIVGLTMQFFLNLEIERYTLVKGESIFVGLARRWHLLPWWFIASTFLGFGWPGIIAAAAKLFANASGLPHFDWIAIGLLIIIGLILSLGPVLYKTVETFQKIVITVGVPVIIILAVYMAKTADWSALASGLIGHGSNYWFFPKGLPLFTFLGALAYAGAGGNLNLAQSFYIKEKGYGMGQFSGRITSLLSGNVEDIALEGTTFNPTESNIQRFKQWWRNINIEHWLIFWLTGIVTITMLSFLAYAVTYGISGTESGIDFIITEGKLIGLSSLKIIGTIFILVTTLTLFATQLTVLDSTSRIIAENIILTNPAKIPARKLSKFYYVIIWAQIIFGIIVFLSGFSEPRTLITIGAVINALAMFVYIILVLIVNRRDLPRPIRIPWWRQLILLIMWIMFGVLAVLAIAQFFQNT